MTLCDSIRMHAYELYRFLGPGFREKVYEQGLLHRLELAGIKSVRQPHVRIHDVDGFELSHEILDLIVDDVVVVELKALRQTTEFEVAQLLGYLKATGFRHGLLVNFGASRFEIKKYAI